MWFSLLPMPSVLLMHNMLFFLHFCLHFCNMLLIESEAFSFEQTCVDMWVYMLAIGLAGWDHRKGGAQKVHGLADARPPAFKTRPFFTWVTIESQLFTHPLACHLLFYTPFQKKKGLRSLAGTKDASLNCFKACFEWVDNKGFLYTLPLTKLVFEWQQDLRRSFEETQQFGRAAVLICSWPFYKTGFCRATLNGILLKADAIGNLHIFVFCCLIFTC